MPIPSRPPVQFCASSDGVRLAYARLGQGTPLVKAANWLTHLEYDGRSAIWRHWLDELAARYTYLYYDTRGCGLSDRDPPEVSLESWVRDLEAVVDSAGLERFDLFGMSQGGAIAIAYAVRHPERVQRLVLYGAFARGRLRRDPTPAQIEEALLYCKLAEVGWGTEDASFRQVFASQFLPDGSPELVRDFTELQRVSCSPAHAARQMQASNQMDVSELAKRIACPTLVMHARGDRRVSFEEGRRLASLIPGARFVTLESRNHVLMGDEPAWATFLRELEAFIPPQGREPGNFAGLTPRERSLLELLAQGLDNHQIAAHLGMSEKTVRNHVSAIFAKLGVDSRGRAIVKAREAGFGIGGA